MIDRFLNIFFIGDDGVGKNRLQDYFDDIYTQNQIKFFDDSFVKLDEETKKLKKNIEDSHILKDISNFSLKNRFLNWKQKRKINKKIARLMVAKNHCLKKKEGLSRLGVRKIILDDSTRLKVSYNERYPFFGVRSSGITLKLNEEVIKIQLNLADTSYLDLIKTYISRSQGAIIMYDITNSNSLNRILEWSKFIKENSANIPILLVGNKLDLEKERVISKEQGIEVKEKNNLSEFMEVSLKTGENVYNMLERIIRLFLESIPEDP